MADEIEEGAAGNTHEEDDVYDEKYAEELEENDEISPEEGAFMQGYDRELGKESEEETIKKKKKKKTK